MSPEPPFRTGTSVMTCGIRNRLERDSLFAMFIIDIFNRHKNCDWGDVDDEDREMNNHSVQSEKEGNPSDMILSSYRHTDGTEVWIITNADRKATTILYPDEY